MNKFLPRLCTIGINFVDIIVALDLSDKDDVFKYLAKANKVQTLADSCRCTLPTNQLIKQIITNLNKSYCHRLLLKHVTLDYINHVWLHTESVQYHGHTPLTLTNLLISLDAPIEARFDKGSMQTFSLSTVDIIKDVMMAPAQETQELNRYREDKDEEDGDDLRIAAIKDGKDDNTCINLDDLGQGVNVLRTKITRTKAQRGYIKQQTGLTKVGDHQPVEIHGLCDGRHNHNRCYMRGEAFWDPAWAKRSDNTTFSTDQSQIGTIPHQPRRSMQGKQCSKRNILQHSIRQVTLNKRNHNQRSCKFIICTSS
jgi:hypothetical protein